MPEWRRICCPIDFSEPSRAALEEAARLARQLGAELMVLHVRPPSGAPPAAPFAPPGGPATERAEGDPLAAWTAEAQRLAPGVTTSVQLSGSPAAEIVGFAREFACDAIVMGTHGRTGLRRITLGSVADAVIRTAGCPVLVVRGAP